MSIKKKGLGKGLNALLGATMNAPKVQIREQKESASKDATDPNAPVLRYVAIDALVPGPFQPRQHILQEGLEQLSESIRTQGIVQPIVVRQRGDKYEIVAGERRFRAAQLVGLTTVPAIVRQIPDEAAMIMALIENIQREDLSPMEEATALKRLADNLQLTHLQIAEAVGKSRASVTNTLRLLTLNPDVQLLLDKRQIEMGHARALLGLKGEMQSQIAQKVFAQGLSVRETERLVNQMQEGEPTEQASRAVTVDPNIRRLEDELADKLGANVAIRHGSKGRGMVVIRYHDVDELEGILAHFK
jgi:ParB family chromosome partitioning protein